MRPNNDERTIVSDSTKQIGFVGATGLMGHGLAKNLLLKGYPLAYTMRNRAPEGLDELGATDLSWSAEDLDARARGNIAHDVFELHGYVRAVAANQSARFQCTHPRQTSARR